MSVVAVGLQNIFLAIYHHTDHPPKEALGISRLLFKRYPKNPTSCKKLNLRKSLETAAGCFAGAFLKSSATVCPLSPTPVECPT